jgi:hypothetical protein
VEEDENEYLFHLNNPELEVRMTFYNKKSSFVKCQYVQIEVAINSIALYFLMLIC